MVEMAGSEIFSQNNSEKNYDINTIVGKIDNGQVLETAELTWLSRQVVNGAIDWSQGTEWIEKVLPQLKAEMEKSIEKGEDSRTLRDSDRGEMFTVSQAQRRGRIKGGQLGYQEWKQSNAKAAIKEADATLASKKALEHMKIKRELPEGTSLDDLIKNQQEASQISGWRHPLKKWRSHRTLKDLQKLQAEPLTNAGKADIQSFLDTATNVDTWGQRREKNKELDKLLDTLPSSELAADGELMKGLDDQIARLEQSKGYDKKQNKEIDKTIKRLQRFKERIAAKAKKRDEKLSKREKTLEDKHGKHRTTAEEKFKSSAEVTQNRDEKLQDTTLFSKTLQSLEAQGINVSELKEQYRQQVKNRGLEELPPSASPDEAEKVVENENSQETQTSEQTLPAPDGSQVGVEDERDKTDGATVEAQQDGENYMPLKDIEYKHQVDGQEKTETYQGDAISHSAEDDRYAIDLEKAKGEELDKACMATLAHIKESGQNSFRIDENTPVELYDALVKAAENSGMTIENQEQLKEAMDKKREEEQSEKSDKSQDGAGNDKPKENDEPTLTPEQRNYLKDNGYVAGMQAEDIDKLKWSNLDKAQQELLTRDGLGQKKEGEETSRPSVQEEQKKEEPQTEQEKLLTKSEALKGIRGAIDKFDLEKNRYNISSEADFQEKIADLSPAEQRAAQEIRGLQIKENQARDKARKAGEPFDKKKEEEFSRNQGGGLGTSL